MNRVTSNDGTSIAYDRQGSGPAVILVGGGLDDGSENAPLVPVLAEHFTVYNYARRGRGASGDTQPYARARVRLASGAGCRSTAHARTPPAAAAGGRRSCSSRPAAQSLPH